MTWLSRYRGRCAVPRTQLGCWPGGGESAMEGSWEGGCGLIGNGGGVVTGSSVCLLVPAPLRRETRSLVSLVGVLLPE